MLDLPLVAAILLLFVLSTHGVSFQAHLRRSASSTPSKFIVDFSFTNTDGQPFKFLRYGTPFDVTADGKLLANVFWIESDSANASFSGILAKRVVKENSWITIAAGETSTVSIDLLKSYKFPVVGDYEVILDTTIQIHPSQILPLIAPETPEFTVTADVVHPQAVKRLQSIKQLQTVGTLTYVNCTAARKTVVQTALANAFSMLTTALTYIANPCSVLPVWKSFFGSCNNARFANTQTFYTRIQNVIANGLTIDCTEEDCGTGSTYAFVFPDETATHPVHLCDLFWTSNKSSCQFDSQAGTFIHEISHFDDTAANDDHAYGLEDAISLAKTDPVSACNNADNYEYFAENCPVVPANRTGFIGCYIDQSSSRDLIGPFVNHATMTIEMCHEYCAGKNYSYYGLQAGTYCYCDNTFGSYGAVASSNCLTPCGGNKGEACGASLRNAIYSVAGSPALVHPGPAGYIGCYIDQASPRALSGNKTTKTTMTIEYCQTFCHSNGQTWPYYGVQGGTLCFCGTSYDTYGLGANCVTPCKGNTAEICGGSLRNSVYGYPA